MTMTMSRPSTLGARLRRERRLAGMTQEELAQEAGVSVDAILRIERSYVEEPRVTTIRKIARALNLEVRDLIDE